MADTLHSPPHSSRNRGPILGVLKRVLVGASAVLEIGCGSSGQAPYFAAALAPLKWLASDFDPGAVESATAWHEAANADNLADNLLAPIQLDAAAPPWPLPASFKPDAIVSINMIHIAPFTVCEGLMAGAGALLPKGGVLYLYGPYKRDGTHTAPSNAMFDQSLRARDPRWGLRDLETVIDLARDQGLSHIETIEMPANNLSVVFRRN